MSNIEKSLESKSQSISDWWNCVPSLDKLGVSGTLLVRLSDAVNEVKKIKKDEYAKLLKDLEFDGFDSVSYEYGLKKGKEETEVRVREETDLKWANKILEKNKEAKLNKDDWNYFNFLQAKVYREFINDANKIKEHFLVKIEV